MSDEISELRERVRALEAELHGLRLDMIRLPTSQVSGMDMVPVMRALGQLEGAQEALSRRVGDLEAARSAPPPGSH